MNSTGTVVGTPSERCAGRTFITHEDAEGLSYVREIENHSEGVSEILRLDVRSKQPLLQSSSSIPLKDLGVSRGMVAWRVVELKVGHDASMHRSATIDLVTVLAGHVTLLLDKDQHELHVGDRVIQRGVSHGWLIGDTPAIISVLIIGAN